MFYIDVNFSSLIRIYQASDINYKSKMLKKWQKEGEVPNTLQIKCDDESKID